MKNRKKGLGLTLAVLLPGIIAMLLRQQLYLTAVDVKGLLLRNTPLELLVLALTGAVLIFLLLVLRKDRGSNSYTDNYSASILGALGHVAGAAGIFLTVYTQPPIMEGYIGTAWQILGMGAPACLLLAGVVRLLGRKPFFLLHVIPSLFYLLHVVNCYQLWSSDPQMQNYLFTLLSTLALALFAHYTAAFEADCGNRRMTLGTALAAVYLCLAELGHSTAPFLYLGSMLWALTGMCKASCLPADEKD